MIYTLFSVLLVIIAAYLLFRTAKYLWRNTWFMGWFRGMIGMIFFAVAILFGLAAWDIFSYKQILAEKRVCSVSFRQLESQHFMATLTDKEGKTKQYELRGDQWQIDARIVKWNGTFAKWGIKPAYRLDRIGGRYFDLEKETSAARTAHTITESPGGVDIWQMLNQYNDKLSIVDAIYGNATYLPMKDKASFEITLSNTGLVARPINAAAREAVSIFD